MKNTQIFAAGLGLETTCSKGNVLEVYQHKAFIRHDGNAGHVDDFIRICEEHLGYTGGNQVLKLPECSAKYVQFKEALDNESFTHTGSLEFLDGVEEFARDRAVITILETDEELDAENGIGTTAEVYLKLSLLSHRVVKPHGVNLKGMFGLLPNVAWTSEGAVSLDDLPNRQLQARALGKVLHVYSVDKFPQMTNHVVPTGIRVGDASRIRLGAHVGEGTTVMHEGFINFNAGTMGVSMVEGRISAGVVVGNGSDIGGGASTMGTLSGGNNVVISVGENCLLGANAGLGLPLGDRCTLEAGLYVTGGSKVTVLDDQNNEVSVVKAAELAGKPDLLFRRNSQNGRIEVKTNKSAIELNEELHKHN